jgi:hypothetical protein
MEQKSLHVQVAQVAYFCVCRWIFLGQPKELGWRLVAMAGRRWVNMLMEE